VAKNVGFTALTIVIAITSMVREAMSKPECDPLRVAEAYVAKRFPSFDSRGLKRVISEKGDLWEVRYELPAGMLGGGPVVTVDLTTCKVVRAVHMQ